ncbi:MAG: MFS transporter [Planctomycetota bacterium]
MSSAPSSPSPRLARNVTVLGVISLLGDVGSEMVFPLLPAFLSGVLGGGALALAWVEGVADAVAALVRFVAGAWSDRIGRCRPFVIAGYAIAALSRPLFALAAAPWHVVATRAVDRTGKGLRSPPRDALLASSVPPERRAWAFGFHRSMDHLGAAIGPLIAFAMLAWFATDMRTVFIAAAIPGVIAVMLAASLVRELPPDVERASKPKTARPSPELRGFLIPFSIFLLGSAGDEFLLLRLGEHREDWSSLPLLWTALHVVRSACAAPAGRLADRIGMRPVLVGGWVLHAAVFLGFAFVDSRAGMIALFLLHGARTAATEGAEKKMIAMLTPKGAHGIGFAWYYFVLALAPRLLFGGLWEFVDEHAAFGVAAGLAGLAVAVLMLGNRRVTTNRCD